MQQTISTDSALCQQDLSRIDAAGRAYAGSQRQIQSYVNDCPELLSRAVAAGLRLDPDRMDIRWVSPIRSDRYAEYRDSDFLRRLGLSHCISSLGSFWPRRGPCWDALARFKGRESDGYVLIEAKSHIPEIRGNGSAAAGRSRMMIEEALAKTKVWLGVDIDANWMGRLYQSANRYAHLYFLREIAGVDAYLINLYFTNDPHSPTSRDSWEPAIQNVNRELGLKCPVPYSGTLFLDAMK
jgi:hypothetical protein